MFWEARRIFRGYRKRNLIIKQLLAENVYASTFAFRGSNGKHVEDFFPSLFRDDDEEQMQPMTDDERADLQADMDAWNAQLQAAQNSQ